MKFKAILVILLALALVVFGLQNTEVVNVEVWFWQIQTPRALLILLCLAFGVLIGIALPSAKKQKAAEYRNSSEIKELNVLKEKNPEKLLI